MAWTALAWIFQGFAVSVIKPEQAAPAPLQLQPHQVDALLQAVNSCRATSARIFNCQDPKLAFKAAVVLYAATMPQDAELFT